MVAGEALADEARYCCCCCCWLEGTTTGWCLPLLLCGLPLDEDSSSLRGDREDDAEEAALGDGGGEWIEPTEAAVELVLVAGAPVEAGVVKKARSPPPLA